MFARTPRSTIVTGIVAALVFGMQAAVMAQAEYPNRTIKIVVPFPPGPVADVLPRIVAEKLAARWSQPVIVENRPGASQNLGTEAVARAEPDGYTLLVTPPGPLVVSQYFFPKLNFDPIALIPVTVMFTQPPVLVVNPKKIPVSSLQELIAYAKANPGKISYGSPGAGSTPHLAMEKLTRAAGIHFVHVPYQGMAPAQRDLLAGHIDVMIDSLGNALPQVRSGALKLLAVTTEARLPDVPEVPTISEVLPGFVHAEWFAVVAPPKTPQEIVAKLSQAIAETLRSPDVAARLHDFSLTAVASPPAETAAFIQRERESWRQFFASTGIKAE